jgi:hypothetical protein
MSPPGKKGRSPGLENLKEREAGWRAGVLRIGQNVLGKQGREQCRGF